MSLDVEGRPAMSQWEALHQAAVRKRYDDMLECDACRLAAWLGCEVARNTDDAYMAMQPDCEGQDGPCIRHLATVAMLAREMEATGKSAMISQIGPVWEWMHRRSQP